MTGNIYEILTGTIGDYHWAGASNGQILAGAMTGGFENGSELVMCRANINGGPAPGKMVGGYCDVSWGGSENFFSSYEQLIPN
jgi:hypothetical protein